MQAACAYLPYKQANLFVPGNFFSHFDPGHETNRWHVGFFTLRSVPMGPLSNGGDGISHGSIRGAPEGALHKNLVLFFRTRSASVTQTNKFGKGPFFMLGAAFIVGVPVRVIRGELAETLPPDIRY
jgi:hypothetical protein